MPQAFFIGGTLGNWLLDDPGFDVHYFRGETYYRDELEPYYVLKGHQPTDKEIDRKNRMLGYKAKPSPSSITSRSSSRGAHFSSRK